MGSSVLTRFQRIEDDGIPIERIAVAFGAKGRGVVLAWVGEALDLEDEQGGEDEFYSDISDLFDGDREGIWVWEGWPKAQCYRDYESSYDEFDGWSFSKGSWREPTNEELACFRLGDNPWTEKCPDCAPCPHCNGSGSDCASTPIQGCKHCEGDGRMKPPPLPEKEPTALEAAMTELSFGSDFKPFKEPPKCPRCKSRGVVRCDERSAA